MEQHHKAVTAASRMTAEERLKIASMAMASNMKLHATGTGGEKGTAGTLSQQEVEAVISDWPSVSVEAVRMMIKYYGLPNEATASRVIWFYNGPWKRTIVHRDEIPHDFPVPHVDVLEQVIDYPVPAEKVGEIGLFDKSVIIAQTMGEVAARCDNEAANILALNLVHDIASGKLSAETAREKATEQITAYLMNRSAPYAESFQFELPNKENFNTDVTTAQNEAFDQAVAKIKESLGMDEKK